MRKVINATQGKALTNGKIYGLSVFLAENENENNYYEIPLELAEQIFNIKSAMDEREIEYWSNIQENGKRTDYNYAFFKWISSDIFPYHPINADSVMYMFLDCKSVKDLSKVIINCTSDSPNLMYICANCLLMEQAPIIKFTNPDATAVKNYVSAYANCMALTSVSVWWGNGSQNPVSTRNNCQNMFFKCEALTDIEFTGQGSPLSLDLSYCTRLTKASVMSLYDSLMDVSEATAGVYKILLHVDTLGLLTEEEIENFNSKGWLLEGKDNEDN